MRPIAFLSDFGTRDPWVGEVKGRILTAYPEIRIHDLAHDLAPGDVAAGAFHLSGAAAAWPPETVFLAVVDPGVGTARRATVARIRTKGEIRYFVGPDNGLLSDFPPESVEFFEIRPTPTLRAARRGTTFDGRDLFAPSAAALAAVEEPEFFGPRIRDPVRLPEMPPSALWYVDRFGNALTNVPPTAAALSRGVDFGTGPIAVAGLRASYAEADSGEAILLVSSRGTVEIALGGGSFAAFAGLPSGGAARGRPVQFLDEIPDGSRMEE